MKRSVAILVFLFGCQGQTADHTTQGLSLDVAQPAHVAGSYVDGELGIRFDALRTDSEISLRINSLEGEELYLAIVPLDPDKPRQLRLLGGAYDAKMLAKQPIVHDGDSDATVERVDELEMYAGNPDTFMEFMKSDHAALLPQLSKALGDVGIDGQAYPAAYNLHMVAVSVSKMTGINPYETGTIEKVGKYNTCDGWSGFHNHYGNDCYAQCGPEGTCWESVCGDCGDWTGCGGHDADCHWCGNFEGGWYYPTACFNCGVPWEALGCGGWGHYTYSSPSCSHANPD